MKKILLIALMLFCIAQTTTAQNYELPKDSVAFKKVEHDFDKDGTKDLCVLVREQSDNSKYPNVKLLLFLSSDYKKTKKPRTYEEDLRSGSSLKMQGETLVAHLDFIVAGCYEQNLEFLYDKKLKDLRLIKYSDSSCGDEGSSSIVDFAKKSYSLSGSKRITNAAGEDELKEYDIKGTSDQFPTVTFQNLSKDMQALYEILADRINKE